MRVCESRNLFEVGHRILNAPKVAEYGNLGLEDAIPLGIVCLNGPHLKQRQ